MMGCKEKVELSQDKTPRFVSHSTLRMCPRHNRYAFPPLLKNTDNIKDMTDRRVIVCGACAGTC
jgi:hypothetical protein